MRLIVLFLCALCTTAKGALEGTHDLGDRSEAERAAQQVAEQQAFGYDPMIRQMQAQRERVREVSQQRRAQKWLETSRQQEPATSDKLQEVFQQAEMRERDRSPSQLDAEQVQNARNVGEQSSLENNEESEGIFPARIPTNRIHVRHKHVYVRRRSAYIGAQNSPLSAIISVYRGLIQISQMRNQDAKRKRLERKLASLVASIEPTLVSLDKHDSNRVLHDTERIIRLENMKTSSTAVNGRMRQLQIGEARDALTHALEIKSHQDRRVPARERSQARFDQLTVCQQKFISEGLDPSLCTSLRRRRRLRRRLS
jgi:hypothetical protein